MKRSIKNTEEAFLLLNELNAPSRLIIHAELVKETAEEIIERLSAYDIPLDYNYVRIAAVLHDAGKIIIASELSSPGKCHEEEGKRLLLRSGIDPALARCCLSHAGYNEMDCTLEELLVALADKLWKGKREPELELMIIDRISRLTGKERWDLYLKLDNGFEDIAEKGSQRLNRSLIG